VSTIEAVGLVLAIAGIVISLALAMRTTRSKSQTQTIDGGSSGIQAGNDVRINDAD
jgi:hypothetical protein